MVDFADAFEVERGMNLPSLQAAEKQVVSPRPVEITRHEHGDPCCFISVGSEMHDGHRD